MNANNKLILVSTFRHFFLAVGLAFSNRKDKYHLVFIDQKFTDDRNPLLHMALNNPKPFVTVSYLPERKKGLAKARSRAESFRVLRGKIKQLSPTEIITGNDRRVEFQYSMYFSKRVLGLAVIGSYLDDGAGSYVSFNSFRRIKRLSDRYIDAPIKRIVYGDWYKRPVWLGCSEWVDNAYLTLPEIAPRYYQDKKVLEISKDEYFESNNRGLLESLGGNITGGMESGRGLIILPPMSILEDIYGSQENMLKTLRAIVKNYGDCYIKYHPRDIDDPLNLAEKYQLLPAAVPLELIFSMTHFRIIIGDVSSGLLAAKWLQPSSHVRYIMTSSKYTLVFLGLFDSLGITPVEI